MTDQFKILGVKIDNLSKKEIFLKLENFLENDQMNQIATVNPEIILKAQEDDVLKNIINESSLALADGVGVRFAFWRFGRHLKTRMPGIDLMWKILELANDKELNVLLVANKNGLTNWEEVKKSILKVYPKLKINGVSIDPRAGHYDRSIELSSLSVKEGHTTYDVLFCNFGSPYQEKFIAELNRWNDWVRLAVGVGGSFEFVADKISRAPRLMRIFGLEWVWRLIKQPKRLRRIMKATIVFPIKILFSK
ncbi:MAG: WecB/TagA/CpsF family glycosyltransferase [Candidatus Moraniibacteriota bacterium]